MGRWFGEHGESYTCQLGYPASPTFYEARLGLDFLSSIVLCSVEMWLTYPRRMWFVRKSWCAQAVLFVPITGSSFSCALISFLFL